MRRFSLSDVPEGLSNDKDHSSPSPISSSDSPSRQETKVSDESLHEVGSVTTAFQRKRWTLLSSPSTLKDDTNSAQLLDDLLAGYEPLSPTYKSVYEEALTPVLSAATLVRPVLTPLLIPTVRTEEKQASPPYQAIQISPSLINTQKKGDDFLFTNPTLQSSIQNIAEHRACFKEISGIVQNLDTQISQFQNYEKMIGQGRSPLDLDDFGSCSEELAEKMKLVKECILQMEQKKGKRQERSATEQSETPTEVLSELEKLVHDRNSGRLAAAKSLDRFLRNMEVSVQLREARQRELESDALRTTPPKSVLANVPTFDESVSEFNKWQGEVTSVLGEQMEHTNNIMQQLTEAVKAEIQLFREQATLIARGPILADQMVQARQVRHHAKHDLKEVAREAYNYRAIQRYLTHTALEMKRMPAAEEVLRVVGQVKEIREKNKDIKQKLRNGRKRTSLPAQSSVDADADAVKIRRELPMLRKQVAALEERELLLVQQLNAFASKEYPELLTLDLCSPEVTDDKSPTTGMESLRSPLYVDMIPRNAAQTLYIVRTITTKKAVKKCKYVNAGDQSDVAYCKTMAEELGKSDHSSLAQVNAFWIEDGTPYVEMPFYAGDTFREWAFKNIHTATVSQAREIFESILSAIAYLHQHGIVHGSLSLDNVIMVEKGCEDNSVEKHVPILCGYNFHRRRLTSDDHGVPGTVPDTIATASQDIWDYGYILCEALSTANVPPDIDKQGNAIIPKMVSRLNSRHLQQFLQHCLCREVEGRPSADVALIHPYFTCRTEGVAFGTSSDDLFAFESEQANIKATYEQMLVERLRTKGIIMVEMDFQGQMLQQILNVFTDMQPKDLWKPLIITSAETGGPPACTVGAAEMIFRSLVRCGMFTSGNGSLMSILRSSNTTATYLPNASYTILEHFKAFGRFLCKCITDGNLFPPVLAPSLFKFILGLVPNVTDLETYSPGAAVQLRLKHAKECGHGADVNDQVESILVGTRKPQLEAIRDGFLDASSTWLRPTSLTAFDLALLCHHQYAKHAVHSGIAERAMVVFRRCITFSGFPTDSETPEHFWKWFDSLGPRGRCLFLWFATGRCGLILEREDGLDALLDDGATASQPVRVSSMDREQRKRQPRASIISGCSLDKEEDVAIQSSPYTTVIVIHYSPLTFSANPPLSSPNPLSPTPVSSYPSPGEKVFEEDRKPPSPVMGPTPTRRRGLSRSKGNPSDLFSLAKADAPPKYPSIQRVFAGELELPDYRNLFVLTTQMAKALETFLAAEKS